MSNINDGEYSMIQVLETERLFLRQWQPADFAVFAEMNADPEVMRYFPKLLTPKVSNMIANKCQQLIADQGWGLWAVSLKDGSKTSGNFIGFVGLNKTHTDMSFAPAVEIAWRLRKEFWGQGYATEAARASLAFAFNELALNEVVSFTAAINKRSQLIMQRIGMTNMQDNFYHPALDTNHPLAEHVLYKITRQQQHSMD
ncbi:GNAT family N-acetyltransferase [Psychrobacter sp. AOP22-C1-22]|uniref:GNAT family N-acetyltransferase n=1 Tax=unclassified Psychrobacter TaxID=196806 RepID=UPI001CE418DF|nr:MULTISPECIES: GNAT family N-acetyltransferase [unclassified Psychrobacter]MDN5801426.1 GNAT family N-acetyltransferase [Psychrobacter sp.]MDN5890778.1 GNAT family N-acetyltransferase [Psychrobacter sp.]